MYISVTNPLAATALEPTHQQGVHYLHWTAEVYGLGKAYRDVLGLRPDAFLPFTSDHGVTNCAVGYEGHEVRSRLHISFQRHRIARYRRVRGLPSMLRGIARVPRRVLHTVHPYTIYKERLTQFVNARRQGTLVFFPHSLPNSVGFAYEVAKFIDFIKLIPSSHRPIRLMVHHHDVKRGILGELETLGIQVMSAGNPMHPDFVDRIYEAFGMHNVVASTRVGTEAFLAAEAGLRFLLLGDSNLDGRHGSAFWENDYAAIRADVAAHLSTSLASEMPEWRDVLRREIQAAYESPR